MAKKLLTMLMLVVLLVSTAAAALAYSYETVVIYPPDRTNLTYGPSKYFTKTSSQQNWDIKYAVGPSLHTNVSVYLYDQNLGLQATHNEPVTMYADNSFSYLTGRCVVGHKYKVVMTAPSLPPSDNSYTYQWTP
jgi:hypothetical protein